MNPSNNCISQAQPSPCQCPERTEMCGKQKWEPQNKNQLICNTRNCQLYGVHDTEPMPEYPCTARRVKAEDPNKNSLGSPVGMLASTINFKIDGKPKDIAQVRYATYLKAFARLHLNPETMWTSSLLDDIMREGLALCSASEVAENQLDSPFEIYTESEQSIQREFEMSGYKFQVELMRKFKLNTSAAAETGAKGDGHNPEEVSLSDLKSALKSFFRQHKHCLLAMSSAYTMIWRSRGVFFVLDVCGRRLTDFYADRDKGLAMLLCLKTLENVRHLLVGLTSRNKVDSCTMRELKLVKVVMPLGGVVQRDYGLRVHQYEIINDDYAYLKASLHLTLNKAELLKNRSALPAGVAAMVVSKIDHPATWNMKIIDKILCFGVSFCQACWVKCLATDAIDVEEFPSAFNMGQFRVNIQLAPCKYEGTWHCIPSYANSEMTQAINKAFEVGDHKLLIQINYQMYAVWKKDDFIYLLDPYRHRILGKAGESDIYEQMEKSATMRMFRSFEMFSNTFNHMLLDSNRSSKFFIHTMKTKDIQLREKKNEEEAQLDEDGEVKSLNEHVCFEESDEMCHIALGDISDYEDEELRSHVDELELRTSSSSEDEEVLEEEEAAIAGGEEEEIEGLESSSSSEEENIKTKGRGNKAEKKAVGKKRGPAKKGGKGKNVNKNSEGTKDSHALKKAGETNDEGENTKQSEGDIENKNEIKGKLDEVFKKKAKEDEDTKDKLNAGKASKSADKNVIKEDETNKKIIGNRVDTQNENKPLVSKKKPEETIVKEVPEPVTINNDKKDKENKKDLPKDTENDKDPIKHQDMDNAPRDSDKAKATKTPLETLETNKLPDTGKELTTKHQRIICHKDGSEADDENEDDFFKNLKHFCTTPNSSRYPGYCKCPLDMAVVGSENGSYESLCKLLQAGFRRADRILAMTPWGNFVVFRCISGGQAENEQWHYFLFDGCTCNINRFRHLDLSIGTAGLLCFRHMHDVIEYMRHKPDVRSKENCRREVLTADEICRQYCR